MALSISNINSNVPAPMDFTPSKAPKKVKPEITSQAKEKILEKKETPQTSSKSQSDFAKKTNKSETGKNQTRNQEVKRHEVKKQEAKPQETKGNSKKQTVKTSEKETPPQKIRLETKDENLEASLEAMTDAFSESALPVLTLVTSQQEKAHELSNNALEAKRVAKKSQQEPTGLAKEFKNLRASVAKKTTEINSTRENKAPSLLNRAQSALNEAQAGSQNNLRAQEKTIEVSPLENIKSSTPESQSQNILSNQDERISPISSTPDHSKTARALRQPSSLQTPKNALKETKLETVEKKSTPKTILTPLKIHEAQPAKEKNAKVSNEHFDTPPNDEASTEHSKKAFGASLESGRNTTKQNRHTVLRETNTTPSKDNERAATSEERTEIKAEARTEAQRHFQSMPHMISRSQATFASPLSSYYSAVMEQISFALKNNSAGGKTDLSIQLRPHHLGDIQIKFNTNEQGEAHIIITARSDVRDLLQQGSKDLAELFQEIDLDLNEENISYENAPEDTGEENLDDQGHEDVTISSTLERETPSPTPAPSRQQTTQAPISLSNTETWAERA